jgi:hypothetical protein
VRAKSQIVRGSIKSRALSALQDALRRQRAGVPVDKDGYVADFRDNLLPLVLREDFEADLSAGDGNELQTKFRAAHSSSALAVNCFAPFRSRMAYLKLQSGEIFDTLQFERKCPTGLRGGRAPNLDVVVSGLESIIGIESKLTEYLGRHCAQFSPAYGEQIRDSRTEQGYFHEMKRLMDAPDSYKWLDAGQLIKHAFGLAHTFKDQPVSLLYLFWEPLNPDAHPVFAEHRAEIAEFSERVTGATPAFKAMSYAELWAVMRADAPDLLNAHLDALEGRYSVLI